MGSRLRLPASDDLFAARLPPPERDAVPSPDPVLSSPLAPTWGADVIVGREVADAFELIWPSGEIDDQFLGGPLSEEPPLFASFTDAPAAIDAGPPDDVMPAIERAIGPDPAPVDQSALLPRLPERATPVTVPAERRSALKRLINELRRHSR